MATFERQVCFTAQEEKLLRDAHNQCLALKRQSCVLPPHSHANVSRSEWRIFIRTLELDVSSFLFDVKTKHSLLEEQRKRSTPTRKRRPPDPQVSALKVLAKVVAARIYDCLGIEPTKKRDVLWEVVGGDRSWQERGEGRRFREAPFLAQVLEICIGAAFRYDNTIRKPKEMFRIISPAVDFVVARNDNTRTLNKSDDRAAAAQKQTRRLKLPK